MPITVTSLHLYPVKGCRAVDVSAMKFTADGLVVGDRRIMIVEATSGRFISQRHLPDLAHLTATYEGESLRLQWPGQKTCVIEADSKATPRSVILWEDTLDADDLGENPARWLSEATGFELRLVRLRVPADRTIDPFWTGSEGTRTSFADLAPLLVTNAESLADLNDRRAATGNAAIPMARFRPNIVITGLPAFAEDATPLLRTSDGRLTLRLIKSCARCGVTELDPLTGGDTGDEVLRSLARFRLQTNRDGARGVMFGQNAIVVGDTARGLQIGDVLLQDGQ